MHEAQHLLGAGDGGRCVHPTGEAELLARGDFGFYVELRRRIFADEDGSQAWANAFFAKAGNFAFQFSEDFVADFDSVEKPCGHQLPTFVCSRQKSRIAHRPIKYFEVIKSAHKPYEFFALDSNRAACEIRGIEFARLLCSKVPPESGIPWHALPDP
jgi:hypothetical protein